MIQHGRALSIILGALLVSGASLMADPSATLAIQIFKEGNWPACRRECRRVTLRNPSHQLTLLHAVCGLRLGDDSRPALRTLCANTNAPADIVTMAHYELGRAEWKAGNTSAAFDYLQTAFRTASSADLFARAGYTLHRLLQDEPQLVAEDPGLQPLLKTSRPQWTPAVRAEGRKPSPPSKRLSTAPARWLISFYQTQIGPAIGDRCSLHPSCSRYGLQACRKHGLIGVAAMGDRFVREPSVVGRRKQPVVVNGKGKYADPLTDHDGWIKP